MYKFRKKHRDQDLADIQREIEDNLVSLDKNGNVVINKDIYCRDLITEESSVYIGTKHPRNKLENIKQDLYFSGVKIVSAASSSTVPAGLALHADRHEYGGADELNHDDLAGFVANEHLPGIDEDDMASNSDAHVPTQQSVKTYVDNMSLGSQLNILEVQVFS